jgi:DNA polymerase III epsilon subunit-like protein
VEIDVDGNIIDQYQTLLHPEKELKELKNIVSFITNIDPKDLLSAPTPSEVEKEISHFF